MKTSLSVLLIPFFLFSTAVSAAPSPTPTFSHTFNGTVVEVLEGDLMKVLHKGKLVKVRLADIDCPERGQAFGKIAWEFSTMMVYSGRVTVKVKRIDGFGMTIAEVVLMDKGLILNRELIKAGLAWWERKNSDDTTYGKLEAEARKMKIGLWKADNPFPPWEFRRKGEGS